MEKMPGPLKKKQQVVQTQLELMKKMMVEPRRNIKAEVALQGRPRRRVRTVLPTKPQVAIANPSNEDDIGQSSDIKRFRLSDIKKGSDIICVVPTFRKDEDKCLKMPDGQPKVCSGPNCKAFVHAIKLHGTNEKGETVRFECEMCADVLCPLLPTDIKETVVTTSALIPTGGRLLSSVIPSCASSAELSTSSSESTLVSKDPPPSKFQMPKDWRNLDPLTIGAAEVPDMNIVKQAMEMFETRPLFHPLPRYNIEHELSLDIMKNILNPEEMEKKKDSSAVTTDDEESSQE